MIGTDARPRTLRDWLKFLALALALTPLFLGMTLSRLLLTVWPEEDSK